MSPVDSLGGPASTATVILAVAVLCGVAAHRDGSLERLWAWLGFRGRK